MARVAILSDIHANLSALDTVLSDIHAKYSIDGFAILGDLVNYGMRPNEVIDAVKSLQKPVLINLAGNHEKAIEDNDTKRFATDRGRRVLAYTKDKISVSSMAYLSECLSRSGFQETELDGKSLLFVHGSLSDPFWGKMDDEEMTNPFYAKYDYVISGHSHVPHMAEKFYPDLERSAYRNKKRTVFLNPGSVGQPRNHNPRAQYLYADFSAETFHFNAVEYDIKAEQALYAAAEIDDFYKIRLTNGI